MVERRSEILDRLRSPGPKRFLALDGASPRNALTVPILKAIESTLQRRAEAPDLRLSDYFDFIGGTNTGAVIAAMLAQGMSVRRVHEHSRGLPISGPALSPFPAGDSVR